jgi:hypothetical protein
MGTFDDIPPEHLRKDLVAFARMILQFEAEDRLLTSAPELQRSLGELRQKLFAHEVRLSRHLSPPASLPPAPEADTSEAEDQDPLVRESLRVIRDALRRQEEMLREWEGAAHGEEEEDDD